MGNVERGRPAGRARAPAPRLIAVTIAYVSDLPKVPDHATCNILFAPQIMKADWLKACANGPGESEGEK